MLIDSVGLYGVRHEKHRIVFGYVILNMTLNIAIWILGVLISG